MIFTIGDNPDVTQNTVCASGSQVGGEITDGGIWTCAGTGMFLGFYTTSSLSSFYEIAAYSLFRVAPTTATMSSS